MKGGDTLWETDEMMMSLLHNLVYLFKIYTGIVKADITPG